ncbi:MAG: hypothetical protein JWO43_482 [Candidatus Adlerbacteria bacterium]|nr:hypothetical protein [Candidatus Adlerbacteria bacterium]
MSRTSAVFGRLVNDHLKVWWSDSENRGLVYAVCTLAVFVLAVGRAFYYWNPLVWVAVLAYAYTFIVALCWEPWHQYEIRSKRAHVRRAELVAFVASIFSSCVVVPVNDTYWTVPDRAQTSFTSFAFLTIPFLTPSVYWDSWDGNIKTTLQVSGTGYDSQPLPLECTVKANNIKFDVRDVPAVERYWILLAQSGSPLVYIKSAVIAALAQATTAQIQGKTVQEIATHHRWEIPYAIGTTLGNTLQRNYLRWVDGYVTLDCDVLPFNT